MAPSPRRPVELRGQVFRGTTVLAHDELTRRELRGLSYWRVFPDVYACASLPDSHLLRVRAATLLFPREAVFTGRSAAAAWQLAEVGADDDVECTVPPGSGTSTMPGLRVRRRRLDPTALTWAQGLRVTTPAATVLDLAARGTLIDAVVQVDAAIVTGRVTLAEFRDAAACATGRGSRQARAAAQLADGLAASPQETRLRLLLASSELLRPVAQYVVRHEGRFVARVDFGWPDLRVAVEYDGLWHGASDQFARDRERLNRLSAAGWTVVFVTAADLHRPEELLARIAAALVRATVEQRPGH